AQLAEIAMDIWKFPSLPPDVIERYEWDLEAAVDEYSLDNFEHLHGEMSDLFESLRKRILNLDSSVREEVKKLYIAYKTTTNFVDIVPQKSRLRLSLNMRFDEINDPEGKCNDVTDKGRWGNGDVEIGVSSHDEIEYVM